MDHSVSKKLLGTLLLAGGLAGSITAHALTLDVGGLSYTLNDTGTAFASYAVDNESSHTIASSGTDFGGYGVGMGGSSDGGYGIGAYVGGFIGYYDLGVAGPDPINGIFTAHPYAYPGGSTVEYLLFADADPGASSYSLASGALVRSFSLTDALSGVTQQLLAGTDYLLAIVFDSHGGSGAFSFDTTVATTPIPGAVWLFGTALLGAGALLRRRGRKVDAAMA